MKQHIIFLLIALLLTAPAAGQKRKRATATTPAVPYIEQARLALKAYQFDVAEQLLEKEIEGLKRKKLSTDDAETLMKQAQMGQLKLHATEHITIIDSLVCEKEEVLQNIKLSHESGRIDTYASTYHVTDRSGATLYENEFGNKRFLALPPSESAPTGQLSPTLRLAFADKLGTQWSAPVPLTGLNDNDQNQNYPFLLSDGITLYFAAQGPESMGGYDIFTTRADGEDGTFLTPENMGFPYNSPANDYLFVIDEFAQLGWFVSDRNQEEGKVCIYTFIPNNSRETYNELSDEVLSSRARITQIRDTWQDVDAEVMREARLRLDDLRNGKTEKQQTAEFHFVIDDRRSYTKLSDFKSTAAKQLMQQWQQLNKALETDAIMLQRLRDNYASASLTERQQIAASIRKLESTYYPQLEQIRQLAKEIRNTEINNK